MEGIRLAERFIAGGFWEAMPFADCFRIDPIHLVWMVNVMAS